MSQQDVKDCLRSGPLSIHEVVEKSGLSRSAAAWALTIMHRRGEVRYHKEGSSGKWELVG